MKATRPQWRLTGAVALVLGWILATGTPLPAARNDTWIHVATPEFEVVTPLTVKAATAWTNEFSQYVAALRAYFGRTSARLPALTVVVFSRARDFERYHPLLAPGGKPQEVGGFFARHEAWAVVGVSADGWEDTRRNIFHEGVHWFLSASNTRNAVWLEEGLAEVFSTFRADGKNAEWGQPVENHVLALRELSKLPLQELLQTAHGDLFGNDAMRTGIVYAESWAFVHYLIFGQHAFPRRAIADYTESLSSGLAPDAAFQRAFGHNYREMDRLLDEYLRSGKYFVARQPLAAVPAPVVRPATKLEVENALGRLALAGRRHEEAVTHGRSAVAAAPADPRGHELLGVALQLTGDEAGALQEFEAAVERDTHDFQPYFEVAVAAHQAAAKEHGELSPADARLIANRYERAVNYYPRFRASYENIAGLMSVAAPLGPEDRKFLELGLRLFPDSAMTQIGLAQWLRRNGQPAEARARLDAVLATRAGLSAAGADFAHRLDVAWEREDISREVDQLASAGKFQEAVALLDQKLASGLDLLNRQQLLPVRERLEHARLSQRVAQAYNEQRWAEARAAIADLLASTAPAPVKSQARSALADLDRRKLGLEPENPK
jgi:tetratricopeptide (TPR) repeat protein